MLADFPVVSPNSHDVLGCRALTFHVSFAWNVPVLTLGLLEYYLLRQSSDHRTSLSEGVLLLYFSS